MSDNCKISGQDLPGFADVIAMEPATTIPIPREVAPPAVRHHVAVAVGSPIRVFLIEDDPEAADLTRAYLTEDGGDPFLAEWSPNLLEALNRLGKTGIDVVLLDLGMPELDGYKSYRAVKYVAGNALPIVILTADDRAISREMTLEFGASDYLVKHQITPAGLRQALRNAVLRR